jgi:dTDP-4-amino-4,6-dideoxygalactose transaminase
VNELEEKLKEYLGVKHFFFINNGTIAIQIAIKALDLKGEIITTPFSYVATTSSIVWENALPVFVDINPETFTIDSKKLKRLSRQKRLLY